MKEKINLTLEQSLLLEKIGNILNEGLAQAYKEFDISNPEGTNSFFVFE